jgi:hypothetical protein
MWRAFAPLASRCALQKPQRSIELWKTVSRSDRVGFRTI